MSHPNILKCDVFFLDTAKYFIWGLIQVIMDSLFAKLSTIDNYEEVLAEIVNTAARRFEMKCYMTPKEKHMLLKVCNGFIIPWKVENGFSTLSYLQSCLWSARKYFHVVEVHQSKVARTSKLFYLWI